MSWQASCSQGHASESARLQVPGLVNVDFADVRAIMTNAGSSLMGQGRASGKARARDAALAAISSPLLDVGIERATGIVWNITGPSDLTLFEVNEAAEIIYDLVDPNANLIFGAVVDQGLGQEVSLPPWCLGSTLPLSAMALLCPPVV